MSNLLDDCLDDNPIEDTNEEVTSECLECGDNITSTSDDFCCEECAIRYYSREDY